jgi:hypothetical protein
MAMRACILVLCIGVLAGCSKTEQECFNKLKSKLEDSYQYAKQQMERPREELPDGVTREYWVDEAERITLLQMHLNMDIYDDPYKDVCNYYIHNDELKKK